MCLSMFLEKHKRQYIFDSFLPLLYCVAKIEWSLLHRVNLIEVTYAMG